MLIFPNIDALSSDNISISIIIKFLINYFGQKNTYNYFDQNIESFYLIFYQTCKGFLGHFSAAGAVDEVSHAQEVEDVPAIIRVVLNN